MEQQDIPPRCVDMERTRSHESIAISARDLRWPVEGEKQQIGPTYLFPDIAFLIFSRYSTIHCEREAKRRRKTIRTAFALLASYFGLLLVVKTLGPYCRQLLCKAELNSQHCKPIDPWVEAVEILGKPSQIMLDRIGKVRRAQRDRAASVCRLSGLPSFQPSRLGVAAEQRVGFCPVAMPLRGFFGRFVIVGRRLRAFQHPRDRLLRTRYVIKLRFHIDG